jgi:hypothetical protein
MRIAVATLLMGGVVVLALQAGISWLLVSIVIAPPVYVALLVVLRIIKLDELRILGGASPDKSDIETSISLGVGPLS